MSNFRVPYLVGNKFHVDHGIWPVRTAIHLFKLFGGIGDEQSDEYKRFLRGLELDHPIGLTLDQLQLLTWRVREWTVAASSWSFTALAEDIPVVDTDDYAILHDSGNIPEFKFGIERLLPTPSSALRIVTDERDMLAEWRNHQLTGDSRTFVGPPPRDIVLWKTLRNYGVQGAEGEAGNGSPDPALMTSSFRFSNPVVLVGPPRTFNPIKFAPPSGTASGGVLALHILNDYVVYNPTLELFFPNIFFAFGGTALPQFRLGRRVAVFNLLPKVPVGTPPENPDIPVGNLTISFGPTAPEVTVPIGIIQGARGRDTPHTGLTPITLEPWSVQNTLEGSFDLAMTATKFRSFRNSLDQPCFNEASGVQLADPNG